MQSFPINWLAILACVIFKQALGAAWYSPALFGDRWSTMTGVTQKDMQAGLVKALVPDVIGSLIMAYVLVHAVHYAGANTLLLGAAVGFLNWLGFVAVTHLGSVTFEKRPFALFALNMGYLAIALIVMGAILAIWP